LTVRQARSRQTSASGAMYPSNRMAAVADVDARP
jgi:hypothetical protein